MPNSCAELKTVLHIITRLDMGGSAQNTLFTCIGLAEKYNIILAHGLSLESSMTVDEMRSVETGMENANKKGVKIYPLLSLIRRINPVYDFLAFYSIWQLIRKEKPAIVHTHSSKAGLLGRWAAKMVGTPHIIHTPHGHVFYGHFNLILSKVFLMLERISDAITERMIALTDGEREDYINLSVSRAGKIITIHSGVDIERFGTSRVSIEVKKKSLGLNSTSRIIGTVGWLLPIKGPGYLLKAMGRVWEKFSDTQLIYVGKGEMEQELRSKAMEMGVSDRVKFLGWRNDIQEIIPLFDLFVLPSMNEGMGRVIVEAMAAGKPVVASKVGGIPDLVKHNDTGLLVPPGDVDALSKALIKLLNDPGKAKKMGENGKAYCNKFSLRAMLDKIDGLYQGLLRSDFKTPSNT